MLEVLTLLSEAMVLVLLRAQVSSVILLVSMYSSHRSAQVMRHVSQPVVQTGMMAVAISSSNATTGMLKTLVSSLFGDITSLVFLR